MDTPGNEILYSKDPLLFTNPKLIQVGDYCIRDFQSNRIPEATTLGPYEENDMMVSCTEVEDNFDLKITKTREYVIEFHVPSAFFGNIIGTKGVLRKKVEQDTRTSIKIPRIGAEGNIIVVGGNERDVVTAKNRIELIVWQVRDKHPPTHFLSIPMVSDMVKHNFDIFKSNILAGPLIRGLDSSMFQNPNKLHLTIATLVLIDEQEKSEAMKILKECKGKVIDPIFSNIEPLRISLKGLEIMNDDPTNVDILYGKVTVDPPKYNDLFQQLADDIVEFCASKGIIRQQYEHVKLHVTLINSLFYKTENKSNRQPFDSTYIMEKYKNFYFGDIDLKYIHLSIRFTTSEGSYFDALSTIPIY